MHKKTNSRCPRCKSIRLDKRMSGENHCKRCGQRWTHHGLLIPSFDRRRFKKGVDIEEDRQLPLILY